MAVYGTTDNREHYGIAELQILCASPRGAKAAPSAVTHVAIKDACLWARLHDVRLGASLIEIDSTEENEDELGGKQAVTSSEAERRTPIQNKDMEKAGNQTWQGCTHDYKVASNQILILSRYPKRGSYHLLAPQFGRTPRDSPDLRSSAVAKPQCCDTEQPICKAWASQPMAGVGMKSNCFVIA